MYMQAIGVCQGACAVFDPDFGARRAFPFQCQPRSRRPALALFLRGFRSETRPTHRRIARFPVDVTGEVTDAHDAEQPDSAAQTADAL